LYPLGSHKVPDRNVPPKLLFCVKLVVKWVLDIRSLDMKMFQLNSRTIDLYKAIIDRTVMLLIITVATVSLTGVFQLANAATPTTLFSMGTLGGTSSSGNAVSATGQVVGWSDITNDTYRHGFYWDSTNGIVDLAPSENISTANGINNNNRSEERRVLFRSGRGLVRHHQ